MIIFDNVQIPANGFLKDLDFPLLPEVISGETTDVYFRNTQQVLEHMGIDPHVGIKIFCRKDGVFCGIKEVKTLLRNINFEGEVYSLHDGDVVKSGRPAMKIICRYSRFGVYETSILGILASATGWATAAREVKVAAEGIPVVCFGARHVHPNVAGSMDYAAIIGGCTGCSTPLGASLAGLKGASGTMPHALMLCVGDTLDAFVEFHATMDNNVPRIVLVDTFRDEVEESLRLARYAKGLNEDGTERLRLDGVRLDTPSERGGVTPGLVRELRYRLNMEGFNDVTITVSGGFDPEKISLFARENVQVDAYGVGSYISGATPIDYTADIRSINGEPIAKRGRIPGFLDDEKLEQIW